MDFTVLSLPEAAYLYMGLAIQALVRQSSLRWLPGVIVLIWTLVLFGRSAMEPPGRSTRGILGYLGCSLIVLVLFWPEATPFGRDGAHTTPEHIASYAAMADPGAQVRTAADTGDVPTSLQYPALLPPGFRLLLRAITETPLALARVINTQAHRPFAPLQPMQWLLTQELPGEAIGAMGDFAHACYLPAKLAFLQSRGGATPEELEPWSPLMQIELSQRHVVPGAQTGIAWLKALLAGQPVACKAYLDTIESSTQRFLFTKTTERGTPLRDVFATELGLPVQAQARFLMLRELLRAVGPEVPAPSLMGSYAALRGASLLGSIAGGMGLETKSAGGAGALKAGGIVGAISGAGHELQRAIDGASWLIGLAVWLSWWSPYIVGLINLVLVGLFPIVVLWALIPGTQFQPLAHYFAALVFTSALPLWWALVDVAQRLAGDSAPTVGASVLGTMTHALAGWAWSSTVTALGIVLIPVVTGILLFTSFRAIGGMWRGGI